MNEHADRPKSKWQRCFLINRRATWLRDVMADKAIGGPAKVAAYAIVFYMNERAMRVDGFRIDQLSAVAGMSESRFREALKGLIAAGWLSRQSGGTHANTYFAVERDGADRSKTSAQREDLVSSKPGEQLNPTVRPKTGEQEQQTDSSKTSAQSENSALENEHVVRSVSSGCPLENERLSARKRAHLTIEQSYSGAAGAREAQRPARTVLDEATKIPESPEGSISRYSAISPSEDEASKISPPAGKNIPHDDDPFGEEYFGPAEDDELLFGMPAEIGEAPPRDVAPIEEPAIDEEEPAGWREHADSLFRSAIGEVPVTRPSGRARGVL